MKLQNTVMQLRKVCSHPFLFDWPIDPNTRYPVLGEELVNASGKMMVLDRLLRELFKRGHKVLLFSQFTTMLDIIEVNIYILKLHFLPADPLRLFRNGLLIIWDGQSVELMEKRRLWIAVKR